MTDSSTFADCQVKVGQFYLTICNSRKFTTIFLVNWGVRVCFSLGIKGEVSDIHNTRIYNADL